MLVSPHTAANLTAKLIPIKQSGAITTRHQSSQADTHRHKTLQAVTHRHKTLQAVTHRH